MKNNKPNSKATALLALGLATCVVIGLVSSTAMKLASATFVMKNSKQPTKNPVVELLEDAIDTIIPDTPAETTPPADTNSSSSDSSSSSSSSDSSSSSGSSSETSTEAPTEAPTEAETKAPETEKETEAPKTEEETKAPETEAPEKEEETTDPVAVAKQNQAVVKLYKDVLTRAKLTGREPSFKKVTYRTLDRALWGFWLYQDVEENNASYFVAEEIAKANPLVVPKATKTTALAINNNVSACLLDVTKLDVITEAVKSASKEVLKDGTVKLVIVLNDEENPAPIKPTDKVAANFTSAMFPVVTAAQVRDAIGDKGIESVNLVYSDCSVELVYRPANGQIVSMKQVVKYEAAVEQGFITAKGTVTEVSDYSNFVY